MRLCVLSGQDGDHLGHRERRRRVDGEDIGMGLRGAQHRAVGGTGTLPHVVGEATARGEQREVLDALRGAPDQVHGKSVIVTG